VCLLLANAPASCGGTRCSSEILLTTRDSPEDHTVLEAAYQENSKPDKSERMEIVKRVTLSEKEVQVCETRDNAKEEILNLLADMVPESKTK
jgi:hypothetical protein